MLLYKGKDTCTLDPNNYRGITLLSVFNKIYEILLWNRLKGWWVENNIISDLQFACKKGLSCTHAAYLLKEVTNFMWLSTMLPKLLILSG